MKFEFQEERKETIARLSKTSKMAMVDAVGNSSAPGSGSRATCRYKECMKNHAVAVGGHAVDGCGEFMAAGPEGTLDSLRCAACNCHRNFHRKEIVEGNDTFTPSTVQHYYRDPADNHVAESYRAVAFGSISGGEQSTEEQEDVSKNPSGSGTKKRFRTKFTQEQKEKMLAFAEKLGWRIQKHDEADVEEFCKETCVNRHVLKVWIHNNRNTLGKKL